ncbi:MAG: SpoIID/LytB domain-containing protein [Deltaproteobacteria bacterium]|nr:SpoIID/LytB domain-containing protein [Deltaproteobacteria bacterium]
MFATTRLAIAVEPPALREVVANGVTLDIETEYLPRVVGCENGEDAVPPAVLRAQAIMARTYLYNKLFQERLDIADGKGLSFDEGMVSARSKISNFSAGTGPNFQDLYCSNLAQGQSFSVDCSAYALDVTSEQETVGENGHFCGGAAGKVHSVDYTRLRSRESGKVVGALAHCVSPQTRRHKMRWINASAKQMTCIRQLRYREAVWQTNGVYLAWNDPDRDNREVIITASYRDGGYQTPRKTCDVDGDRPDVCACYDSSSRATGITYNRSREGADVTRYRTGFYAGGWYSTNRGRGSQIGQRCLDAYYRLDREYGGLGIGGARRDARCANPLVDKCYSSFSLLTFYFGQDIWQRRSLPPTILANNSEIRWPYDKICARPGPHDNDYLVPETGERFRCKRGRVYFYQACPPQQSDGATEQQAEQPNPSCVDWSGDRPTEICQDCLETAKAEGFGADQVVESVPGCSIERNRPWVGDLLPLCLLLLLCRRRRSLVRQGR